MTADRKALLARIPEGYTPGPWTREVKDWDHNEIMLICGPDGAAVMQEPSDFFAYPSCSWVDTGGTEPDMALAALSPSLAVALRDADEEIERLTRLVRHLHDGFTYAVGRRPNLPEPPFTDADRALLAEIVDPQPAPSGEVDRG